MQEGAEATVSRIDTAEEFVLVPPETETMVAVPGSGLPGGLLFGDGGGHEIEVGQFRHIERLIDDGQARLMRQELTHRDALFPGLGELGQ